MKGMAEISVVRYVVTPSMRLVGAAASPIQRKRRPQVISSTERFTSAPVRGIIFCRETGAMPRCLPRQRLEPVMAVG